MRSFVRASCSGFLICGVIALAQCGGDDTTGTPGSGGSSSSSGGSNGTAGSPSSGGSGGAGGSTTGSGGSASGSGGSSGSSAGNGGSGGSGQPDSGMGAGDAQKDTGAGAGDATTAAYNPCPAKGTPCAVMGLGDSITQGDGSSTGGSYRTFLYQLALGHQQTITLVGSTMTGPNTVMGPDGGVVPFPKGSEGHSGFTIDDGGGRTGIHNLTAPAMNMYHPHIITLMIGTNDIDIQYQVATAPTRLGGLLDTIIATDPNVLIVLAQMVPTTDDAENVRVKAYNDAMPALVQTRAAAGKHVILVDMYDAFLANANYKTVYMNDKLHPKDAGYSKMADVWYAAIGPLFR